VPSPPPIFRAGAKIPSERAPGLGSAKPIACDATAGSGLDAATGSGTMDRRGRRLPAIGLRDVRAALISVLCGCGPAYDGRGPHKAGGPR
jgi:hypothetical protein